VTDLEEQLTKQLAERDEELRRYRFLVDRAMLGAPKFATATSGSSECVECHKSFERRPGQRSDRCAQCHKEHRRKTNEQWRAAKKKNGECMVGGCKEPLAPGKTRCEPHLRELRQDPDHKYRRRCGYCRKLVSDHDQTNCPQRAADAAAATKEA